MSILDVWVARSLGKQTVQDLASEMHRLTLHVRCLQCTNYNRHTSLLGSCYSASGCSCKKDSPLRISAVMMCLEVLVSRQ